MCKKASLNRGAPNRSSEAPRTGNLHAGICEGLSGNRQLYLNSAHANALRYLTNPTFALLTYPCRSKNLCASTRCDALSIMIFEHSAALQ